MMQSCVILHNIRSVHNVGSIFRTSDAAGVPKIILSGYTPTPVDTFGRERKDFTKVALGAEKTVEWVKKTNILPVLRKLRRDGFILIAIEQAANADTLFQWVNTHETPSRVAIIFGNEVKGLSKQVLQFVDYILEIPMHGKKESLNVSVTAGIALFTLLQFTDLKM